MMTNKYIIQLLLAFICLLTCNNCIMKNNNTQELSIVRLTNPNKNVQIIITYKYPTEKIRDVVLTENQDLNIYGISFTLGNSVITAKK